MEILLASTPAPPRLLRAAAAAILMAATGGCASLKSMTEDFERKWDEPEQVLAEMDKSGDAIRAAQSSAGDMTAFNANDCARKFGLLDKKSDAGDLTERRLSAGECLLEAGKNDEAARLYAIALEDGPNATALQGKGVALVRLARYDEAAEALLSALEIDPALWRSWNALGVVEDHRGLREDAWAAFRKAAEVNPAEGAPLNNLGVSMMKAGELEQAIAAFKSALLLDGARDAAEANLRLAFAMNGDYQSAIKSLPDDRRAVALNNAGVAAAARGDDAEAKKLFMRALDESPHFYAKAYNNLSLLIE